MKRRGLVAMLELLEAACYGAAMFCCVRRAQQAEAALESAAAELERLEVENRQRAQECSDLLNSNLYLRAELQKLRAGEGQPS